MLEDLKKIRISDIFVSDDIFLVFIFLIIPFGILLLLFTYIYNKIYIKNNKKDFLVLFFGEKGGEDFSRVGGDLVVVAYWFLIYYSNYKVFSIKMHFPSIEDKKNKPIPIIPNTYRENVEVFEAKHKIWLLVNLSSLYLGFILGAIFLVSGFFFID
ncbi:hypothetical protein [Acinetobacter haemolyticus]|uniref:hypothetical protein n=1 Tax=Acinetobacter haemolyticus TaxID=29430 RepID=UPI003F576503